MNEFNQNYRTALEDFFEARRRANLRSFFAKIQGKNYDLLSFDEVRKKLKAEISNNRQTIKEIRLDKIVGSVNRYEDFTRDFFPKDRVQAQRWVMVELGTSGTTGLPPIEVYELGGVYFVIDGNHRVSVANSLGSKTIQAYVYEIKTRVDLDPNDSPEDIIIKAELTDFLQETRLDILRPGSDFSVTAPEAYVRLKEHIAVHQYFLGLDESRDVEPTEAITHWYDTYFMPTIESIEAFGLTHDFPGKTKTDIYLWICDYQAILEKDLSQPLHTLDAIRHYSSQHSPASTAPSDSSIGELRRQKKLIRQESCLFSDILIPINGSETSWNALNLAIEISKKENSTLNGLHVVADEAQKESPSALDTQRIFNQTCQQAGAYGQLVIVSGNVTARISERSGISDLIVVNLAYPPEANALSRLTNGFRNLVQRSPRPVFACPETSSRLEHALLAYDGSPTSQEALYIAAYLAGKWNTRITVLTIKDSEKNREQEINPAIKYLFEHNIQAELIEEKGSVAPLTLQYVQSTQADFIIMGGYGSTTMFHFLFDTVADQILRESSVPMLLCR